MIEPGETPKEAISREFFEEIGLIIKSAALVKAYAGREFRHQYPNGDKVEYTVLVYSCLTESNPQNPTDPETLKLECFDQASMPELALPYPKSILFAPKSDL